MKKGLTELVFILDKSGSMGGLEADTIGGYNSMLAKQQAIEGECLITTVLFDNNYELLHDRIDLKAVSAITEKEYQVGGSTALLDAIGRTIHKIGNAQKHTADNYRAEKVMFVIITDGEENSSREYSAEKVKAQIERQKTKYGWEFIFLGANIDAVETAGRFGITPDRAVDYIADSEGTKLNYTVMAQAVTTFREVGTVDEACFECEAYPWKMLKALNKRYCTKYHMSMIENLNFIRENGIKKFLAIEEEKWRCPECSRIICCHSGLCLHYYLDALLQKKIPMELKKKNLKIAVVYLHEQDRFANNITSIITITAG